MNTNAILKNAETDLTDWERIDAMIDAEIDQSDHPEWTDAEFSKAQRREPNRFPIKEKVTIDYSPEVLAAFRSTGHDWQTRMDEALKDWLKTHSPA
ncbi:BrnA antitoxin family protein [Chromatium okenii]|uniref:BrnA antitoxin family protein n=1 Tax=Chromatium okenii TaxID=61644 RepID=UPI0026F25901|nr:BrnA antitoxin family protein [Chromatium okenii]